MIWWHRVQVSAFRNEAPNGARFDNPGRSPGYETKVLPAPTGNAVKDFKPRIWLKLWLRAVSAPGE